MTNINPNNVILLLIIELFKYWKINYLKKLLDNLMIHQALYDRLKIVASLSITTELLTPLE